MIDSMVALRVGVMPMSLQKATRCACGIAIGMQQQKPAMQISSCARLGCSPATRRRPCGVAAAACVVAVAGASTGGNGAGFQEERRRQDQRQHHAA